jgi:phytoene dehydrogenase-like protein
MGRIVDGLLKAASNLGVVIHLSTPIERVGQEGQSFRLSPGTDVTYDKIIFNCDPRVAQRLLPGAVNRRARQAQLSTSGVVINVGKRRPPTTPLLSHHNVFFAPSYRDEYRRISAGGAGSSPTVYLCASSVTDATQAPSRGQNWFVLINVAANTQLNIDDAVAACESTLNSHNLSLYDDAAFVDIRDPAELAHRTSTPNGAIYGTSSDGYSAALVRQSNRGRIAGTYFVGGGAHPGGGIPLVLGSAEIVVDLIKCDTTGPA